MIHKKWSHDGEKILSKKMMVVSSIVKADNISVRSGSNMRLSISRDENRILTSKSSIPIGREKTN